MSSSARRVRSDLALAQTEEQSRQCRAHQVGQGSGRQCFEAQLCDDGTLVGRQSTCHGHLDGNRREVGETAQGERHDPDRGRRQGLQGTQINESDKFVEDDLGSEQPAGLQSLAPWNAQQKHDRRKDITDNLLEAEIGLAKQPADSSQNAIGECDERDKGEHHRTNGNGQLDPGLRALGRGHDDVGRFFFPIVGKDYRLFIRVRIGKGRVAAAFMSAPGGILMAKLMMPGADMKAAASK